MNKQVSKSYRTFFDVKTRNVSKENRTIALSFSSEEPVERWDGEEILDHAPQSVRLERLENGGPLLVDHDPSDHVGVIEKVSIDPDRVGRALVRFGKSPRATEIFNDVIDGIRKSISVGYRVFRATEEDGGKYRVIDWMPLEISFVSVPADASVGVGRADTELNELIIEDSTMETKKTEKNDSARAVELERARISEIQAICRDFNRDDIMDNAVKDGLSVDAVRTAVLNGMEEQRHIPQVPANKIGDTSNHTRDAVNRDLDAYIRSSGEVRGLSIGTGSGSNAVIPFRESSLETLLREGNPFRQLVDVIVVNDNGSFEEIISSGAAQSVYIGESDARPELTNPVLNKIVTTLMEIYSLQTLTQRLVSQSYLNLADWISNEMAISIAETEANAFVNGSGTGDDPLGLVNQTYATTADSVRAFGTIQKVASGNASLLDDPDTLKDALYSLKAGHRKSSTWVMNSATARVIQKMKDGQGLYIWSDSLQQAEPDVLLGRPVVIAESCPDIGAGTLPIFIADWKQAIRFINNSQSEISADPYSNKPHIDYYSWFLSGFALRNSEAIKAVSIEV